MYVRFQFESDVFAEQVRDKLARSDVGCIPPTSSGFLITRIAFPKAAPLPIDVGPPDPVQVRVAGAGPVTADRRKLLLTLPVELEVRTVTGLTAGTPLAFTINVQLSVDLVQTAGGPGIQVAYHDLVHHQGTDPGIEQLVRNELGGALPPRPPVPFEYTAKVFEALASITGGGPGATAPPNVIWSGMTLSTDRRTVEFRLEISADKANGSRVPSEWQAFHRREIDDLRGGRSWAVAIPQESLVTAVAASARKEITDQGDIHLDRGPDVQWRPDFPGFRVTFSGELQEACVCLFDDPFDDDLEIDLDIDVTLDLSLALRTTGAQAALQLHTRSSVDASDLESACCAVTAAALWPAVGLKYLTDGRIDGWGMVVGLAGGPLGALLAMAAFFDPRPHQHVKENCVIDPDDDKHQICTYSLNLNPAQNACDRVASEIWVEDVRGRPDALVLGGRLVQEQLDRPGVRADEPTPFEWIEPPFRCNGALGDWSARSAFEVSQVGGEYPLIVGGVVPVGPARAIYQPKVVGGRKCPTRADVQVDTLPWTVGNENKALMAVLTNVGGFLVAVPPLPPLARERIEQHAAEFPFWKVNNCYIFQDDWWARGLDPHWLPYPPPDSIFRHRHLWVLEYAGLRPGETLVVHEGGPDGEILATGVWARRKAATLSFLNEIEQVFITRDRSLAGEDRRPEPFRLLINQHLLQEVDVQRFEAPVAELRSVGSFDRPALELAGAQGSSVVGIDSAGFLVGDRSPGRLLGVGRGFASAPTRSVGPVQGGNAIDRAELVQTAGGSWSELGLRSAPPGGAVVRATQRPARWLVEAGGDGFVEVDARAGRATAAYRDRPWSDGMVRLGRTFVRLDDDGLALRSYRIAATARI